MSADRSGPSLAHLMGTDNFGRDILCRVMKGAGTTASIALATLAIGAAGGCLTGARTGYFGGPVDALLMRLNDALTAFPSILLALVVISLLEPGKKINVILSLGLVFIPSFARVSRTAFAGLRDGKDFVMSHKDIMKAYGENMKMVDRIPDVLSGAMGNQMYVATFPTQKRMDQFYKDVLECREK